MGTGTNSKMLNIASLVAQMSAQGVLRPMDMMHAHSFSVSALPGAQQSEQEGGYPLETAGW